MFDQKKGSEAEMNSRCFMVKPAQFQGSDSAQGSRMKNRSPPDQRPCIIDTSHSMATHKLLENIKNRIFQMKEKKGPAQQEAPQGRGITRQRSKSEIETVQELIEVRMPTQVGKPYQGKTMAEVNKFGEEDLLQYRTSDKGLGAKTFDNHSRSVLGGVAKQRVQKSPHKKSMMFLNTSLGDLSSFKLQS